MKYGKFRENVIEHLEQYKHDHFPDMEDGTFKDHKKAHILPKGLRNKNLLPMSIGIEEKNYHMYAHHLNSSQMMCINFFSPLCDGKNLLVEMICKQLNIKKLPNMEIKKMEFEYTPDGFKHTNFDIFVEFTTGEKIYFEVKYTESDFGGISEDIKYPNRYQDEWEKFYKKQLSTSIYLKNNSQPDFYNSYQINRNIAYVQEEKDYVCFVYPFENDNLYKELESIEFRNIIKIDWDDFCNTALIVTEGTNYHDHYIAFREKYLDYKRD